MKKFVTAALMGAMVCSFGVASAAVDQDEVNQQNRSRIQAILDEAAAEDEAALTVVSPIMEVKDLHEARKYSGFYFGAPDLLFDVPVKSIAVYTTDNKMTQVIYDRAGDSEITVRKAAVVGGEPADISGVYTKYAEVKDVALPNGINVRTSGQDGKIYLATWTVAGFDFSLHDTAGITNADLEYVTRKLQ